MIDQNRLTDGVLNPYAAHCFMYGACAGLALALHEQTGWPLYAITDAHNVFEGKAGGGSALHYVVRHPSGLFLDVRGLHDGDHLLDDYHDDADDQEAALAPTVIGDVQEWYENQGEPVSLERCATFVEPLIEQANQSLSEMSSDDPCP